MMGAISSFIDALSELPCFPLSSKFRCCSTSIVVSNSRAPVQLAVECISAPQRAPPPLPPVVSRRWSMESWNELALEPLISGPREDSSKAGGLHGAMLPCFSPLLTCSLGTNQPRIMFANGWLGSRIYLPCSLSAKSVNSQCNKTRNGMA